MHCFTLSGSDWMQPKVLRNFALWKRCSCKSWRLCVTHNSIVRQQWWQGKSHLKNHLYICLDASKEVDPERKLKYHPNLMSDINEKKIDRYTHEMLKIEIHFDCLLFSWPFCPWTLTLSARTGNSVKYHVSNINVKNRRCFDLLFSCYHPKQIFKLFQLEPLPAM